MLDGLDGITLLIGAFFFYCLAVPQRVRRKPAYWGVFGVLLLTVLFNTLRLMLYNSPGGQVFTGLCLGILQAIGLVLTVVYVGGLSLRELGENLGDAAEHLRPGSGEKTPIVPLPADHVAVQAAQRPVEPASPSRPIVTPPRVSIELPKSPASSSDSVMPQE